MWDTLDNKILMWMNLITVLINDSFSDKRIPYEMLSTAADFLKYGLKIARITPFFQAFTFLSDAKRS